jgi:hypothetical protein
MEDIKVMDKKTGKELSVVLSEKLVGLAIEGSANKPN